MSVPSQPSSPKQPQQIYTTMLPQPHGSASNVGVNDTPPSDTGHLEPGISSGGGVTSALPITAGVLETGMQDILLSDDGRLPVLPHSLTPAPVTVLRSSAHPSQQLGKVNTTTTHPTAQEMGVNLPTTTHPASLPGMAMEQQVAYRVPLASSSSLPSYAPSTTGSSSITLTSLSSGLPSMPPNIHLPVAPTISLGPTPSLTST